MKKILYAVLCYLLAVVPAFAATYTASDCTHENVQAAIASATTGDLVLVPPGTCTWDTTVTIAGKVITLQGAGSANTHIATVSGTTAFSNNDTASRITGFDFTGPTDIQVKLSGAGWRLDHCSFTNTYGSSRVTIYVHGENISTVPVGVIDNNTFTEGRVIIRGASNTTEARTIWSEDPLFGSADISGLHWVYLEDNTFHKTVSGGGNVIDAENSAGAGKFVARYNTVTGTTTFMAHPHQSATERGVRGWEIYGNSLISSSASVNEPMFLRSGTGFIFGNYFGGYYTSNIANFDIWRVYTAVSGTSTTGFCDGGVGSRAQWDGDSANGWPCRDQIGRGADSWLWTAGNPYPPQASQPTYVWSNLKSTGAQGTIAVSNGAGVWVQANRDYYVQGATFDGTSGVGCGTLTSRPATCTSGVGYWATEQSCSDLTGMVGATPATALSGTLYTCVATNQWKETYRPFAYPHPLRTTFDVPKIITTSGASVASGGSVSN